MKKLTGFIVGTFMCFLFLGNAQATTFTFSGAGTGGSFSSWLFEDVIGDIDLTVEGYSTNPQAVGNLTYDSSDHGIGIKDDEISGDGTGKRGEFMSFTFSEAVFIESFSIVDLFANEGPNGEDEVFSYKITNPKPVAEYSPFGPGDASGDFTLDLNTSLKRIVFASALGVNETWNDFAISGFSGSESAPVPEPSTLLLMGAGLFGLVGYNRKRQSKKK